MDIVLLGWVSKFLSIALWAVGCWCLLAFLDKLNDDPFSEDKDRMDTNPLAIAVYRGARWAAILIGGAIILS